MITSTKSKNSDIAKYFAIVPNTSIIKKQLLINLAKNNKQKPMRGTKLRQSLDSYMRENHGCYDFVFTKTVKKLRPEWFRKSTSVKKHQLIKLAKTKSKKPKWNTSLGRALKGYTSKSEGCYCESFTKIIKKLRPDWFFTVNSSETRKKKIIEMAKSGKNKPQCKSKLGYSFYSYTQNSHDCYDQVFTKLIRKLRPDWFKK